MELVDTVREWVSEAERITVLTGAGISTDSGIPDFRGPQGVWTKNPAAEKAATIQHYLADADVRRMAWQNRLSTPAWTAEPNAGHLAVVELERQGRLHAVVTQNVDGLHQKAGTAAELVVEVHGTIWWSRCWECQDRRPMAETLDRVACRRGRSAVPGVRRDPEERHDLVRPGARARGHRPGVRRERGVRPAARRRLDAERVPGGRLRTAAKAKGARVVIVNAGPTEMDGLADAVLNGSIGDILPAIVEPVESRPGR